MAGDKKKKTKDELELENLLGEIEEIDKIDKIEGSGDDKNEVVLTKKPNIVQSTIQEEEETEGENRVDKFLGKFGDTVDELLVNFNEDRLQIQDAVVLFKQQIDDSIRNDKRIPQVIFQAYVEALKTKSNNNANAVRVLDSIARLMQAGRGGEMFSTGGGSSLSAADLQKLLEDED